MIIDDSDEDEPAKNERSYHDNPDFDEEDAEFDASEPYEPVVQTLDLPLGVEVLHLAFPHLPLESHRPSSESLPEVLSQKLVVAVACSDCSIRVLTVSLMPPSPQSKARAELRNTTSNVGPGKSAFGEEMITLSSGATHQSIPKGVSISVTSGTTEDEDDDIDMQNTENDSAKTSSQQSASRVFSRSRSRSRVNIDQPWDLLIASHSADLSGLLLLHRIPLAENGASLSTELHIPWQIQHLASPAVSVDFNSALYPASRHSQILVTEAKGAVRILDFLPRSKAAQGSWLVSLYTSFEPSQDLTPKRTTILDARWVLGGKAVLVLLADGKWGIWDLENAGPKPAKGVNPSQRTVGGALTTFALDGWAGESAKSRMALKNSSTKHESRSKLAPMTPSTRKMRQEALFTGPARQPEGPARGGLFVSPNQDTSNGRSDDESVLLWLGNSIVVIPSLFIHWQNRVRGSGNLFGSGAKGEPRTINNIQLGGEYCKEVSLFSRQAEILVTGEHRLLIVTSPLTQPQMAAKRTPPPLSTSTDQQLLARGELDVNGMDRILAGMSNGHAPSSNSTTPPQTHKKNILISL